MSKSKSRPVSMDAHRRLLAGVILSLLAGILAAFGGFLLLAKLVVGQNLTLRQAALPALLVVSLGCFLSGFCMGRLGRTGGLLWGLGAAGFFDVVYLVSSLLCGVGTVTAGCGLKLACLTLSGCLGGVLGTVRPDPRRRHRRRAG